MNDSSSLSSERRILKRRPAARGRVAISLGVSALAHAGLLAWVSVTIPEGRHAAAGLDRAGLAAARPSERTIEFVRIQPPGALPSGGAAEGGGVASAAPVSSPPARVPAVSLPAAAASAARLPTLATAPASPMALPALAVAPQPPSRSPSNRGIIRRRPEAGAFPGLGERAGSGSGRGFGGGGVTVAGIGTDCITAGRGGAGGRIGLGLPVSGQIGGSGGISGSGGIGGGWRQR